MPPRCPGRYVSRKITSQIISQTYFPFDGSVGNPDSSQFQIFEASNSGFSAKTYICCQKREYFIIIIIFALKNWYLNIQIKLSRISSSTEPLSKNEKGTTISTVIVVYLEFNPIVNLNIKIENLLFLAYHNHFSFFHSQLVTSEKVFDPPSPRTAIFELAINMVSSDIFLN